MPGQTKTGDIDFGVGRDKVYEANAVKVLQLKDGKLIDQVEIQLLEAQSSFMILVRWRPHDWRGFLVPVNIGFRANQVKVIPR